MVECLVHKIVKMLTDLIQIVQKLIKLLFRQFDDFIKVLHFIHINGVINPQVFPKKIKNVLFKYGASFYVLKVASSFFVASGLNEFLDIDFKVRIYCLNKMIEVIQNIA